MKGEAQSLDWIKDKVFEIPFFQRQYVWQEENWEELWENLTSSHANDLPFIGSFILQEKETDLKGITKFIVIDGQQRLTTITLLIKAFLDSSLSLKNNPSYEDAYKDIESFIYHKISKGMTTTRHPRIEHSSIDKNDFNFVMLDAETSNYSESNIVKCYKYFYKKFSEMSLDDKIAFGDKLGSHVKFFIAIELEKKDDEQKIFDSVNRLGMKLLNSDIIKNNIFQRVKELANETFNVLEVYDKYWTSIFYKDNKKRKFWENELTLGRTKGNQLDVFLKDFAIIKKIYVASSTGGIDGLAKSYKNYTQKLNLEEIKDFIMEIAIYATKYYELFSLDIQNEYFREYHFLNILLLTLRVTKTSTFNAFILETELVNPNNANDLYHAIEKFILKRLIYGESAKNYNKICEQLFKEADPVNYLDNYIDDDFDYTSFPSGLLKINNENAKLILFILELIRRNNHGSHKFSTINSYSSFQLEHIMPIKWKSKWSNVLCYNSDGSIVDEVDAVTYIRESKIKSIGNMTLLTQKLNGSISNNSFKFKVSGEKGIEAYVGGLLIAKEIVDIYYQFGEWNEKYIYKRDKEIFDDLNFFFCFLDKDVDVNQKNVNISIIINNDTKELDINDLDSWNNASLRKKSFYLIKELIINKIIDKAELDKLFTTNYTKHIIPTIKNPLLALPNEFINQPWKKVRYSKEFIEVDGLEIHVNNQFSNESFEYLMNYYNFKLINK